MSYSIDIDENQELFEKPRGERRWLGKEHHRGKERLYDSVKDRTFIEKTVRSPGSGPLSKKANAKLNATSKDGLELNVVYSMDKKNRWRDSDNVTLLGSVSEDVNAEVVQKNALEQYGFLYPNKSTFSVTSRQLSPEDESGVFGIRTAKSSGKGQDYSNFSPKSRELSRKANSRIMKKDEEQQEEVEEKPMVSYNIYKTHRNMQAVGGQMFKAKVVSKSGKHRGNKKFDMEVYNEEDYDDFWEEEEDEILVPVKLEKPTPKSSQELPPRILESEGFTFQETTLFLPNLDDPFNFKSEMELLENEYPKALKIKNLRPNQYQIDASKWCRLDGALKDGETTTVIVITHLKGMKFHVLVNSTIPCHPAKRSGTFLKKQISKCSSLLNLIETITDELKKDRRITETMKLAAPTYNYKTYSEMLQDRVEWENQFLDMKWPNKLFHSEQTNSKELSTTGIAIQWEEICNKVKETDNIQKTEGSNEVDSCKACNQKRKAHELFRTSGNGIKCTNCLRDEFYKEFNARRLPINLEIDNQFENLANFIPLTVINHYVWMVYKERKDLRISGALVKCPSCNFILHFPKGSSTIQNLSCSSCGHFWCKHCDRSPHWPMTCKDYAKWEDKWLVTYALMAADGPSTNATTLAQVTCCCKKVITNRKLPFYWSYCRTCLKYTHPDPVTSGNMEHYTFYEPKTPKNIRQKYLKLKTECYKKNTIDSYHGFPYFVIYTEIQDIPVIPEIIKVVCGGARDLRFNESSSKHSKPVKKVLVTAAYLVEMVTAWMFETGREVPEITKELDGIMENWKRLEMEDSEAGKARLEKIKEGIDVVVKAVQR